MKCMSSAVAAVILFAITGCSGGGGGNIRPEPPIQCPDGTQVPAGQECPTTPSIECPDGTQVQAGQECPVSGVGRGPLPGIDRIPRSAIRASNSDVAQMYTILEFNAEYDRVGGHARLVARAACDSFITGCDSGQPFTMIDASDVRNHSIKGTFRELIPSSMKIVSGSFAVDRNALTGLTNGKCGVSVGAGCRQ